MGGRIRNQTSTNMPVNHVDTNSVVSFDPDTTNGAQFKSDEADNADEAADKADEAADVSEAVEDEYYNKYETP